VQDVQGFLNDGSVRGRGDLRLDAAGLQHVELGLDLTEVSVPLRDELPGTFSGALLLAGKPGAYQLGGTLELARLRYTQELTLESLIRDVRQPRLAAGTGKAVEWLKLDVGVELGNDVRLDNNLARARLVGKLKLGGTNVAPLLTGTVETDAGAQAFFRNNSYAIGRGQLVLSSFEPTFDLSAKSQVREYLVSVKAFGRLDDPNLSLSSEPALSEVDILSLLTLGFMAREKVSSGQATGLAAEALFAASGLDRTVNQFLNSTDVLKDQQVRISTTYNEFTGQAEPSVTWEAGVVSERFRVGITQPVTGRGTRAQVEYRFNDRVSAKGQWDNQIRDVGIGNPGVDLRFRFEWE
jgi:translocation and assembly module TamB